MAVGKHLVNCLLAASSALAIVIPQDFSTFAAVSKAVNSTVCNGQPYEYVGMAGWGFVQGNATDKYGDTISWGSSIAVDRPSITVTNGADGIINYSMITYNLPDRGWNTEGTTNFEPRIYKYRLDFQPYVGGHFHPNMQWELEDTIILLDPYGNPLTGLDALTTLNFPGFPILPAANFTGDGWDYTTGGQAVTTRVALDPESIVLINGTIENGFYISDEYGPYIYKFNSQGLMLEAIQPVDAIVPYRNGAISFSADAPRLGDSNSDDISPADPDSGRVNNQGFEGMSMTPDGKSLLVLLQSAAIQDGGDNKQTRNHTRLFKYDITSTTPQLTGEWVLPLPLYNDYTKKASKNPAVAAQSEIYAVSDTQIFVLARDSNFGHGEDESLSVYRHIDVYDFSEATNIYNISKFNKIGGAVAPNGVLDDSITPATYCSFLDVNVNSQLNRFAGGLHNGGTQDWKLLNEKWEGIALIPADGYDGADGSFYVIIVSDDDFRSLLGEVNFGRIPYRDSGKYNLDNQALLFKIQLPASASPFKHFPAGVHA
ncbi:esterase-like activity of phytase-domain-containing protein [Dipodascopsis uninucleata]